MILLSAFSAGWSTWTRSVSLTDPRMPLAPANTARHWPVAAAVADASKRPRRLVSSLVTVHPLARAVGLEDDGDLLPGDRPAVLGTEPSGEVDIVALVDPRGRGA